MPTHNRKPSPQAVPECETHKAAAHGGRFGVTSLRLRPGWSVTESGQPVVQATYKPPAAYQAEENDPFQTNSNAAEIYPSGFPYGDGRQQSQ